MEGDEKKKMPRIPKYKKYVDMSAEELSRLKGKVELTEILKSLRRGIGQRKSQFRRANEYSPALEKYAKSRMAARVPYSKYSRNQLIMEIVKAQDFYKSKTSTVAGTRQVMSRQNELIFGKNWKEKNVKMDLDTRRRFWQVYNEFNRVYPDIHARLPSEEIQQMLGSMIDELTEDFNMGEAINNLQEKLLNWEQERYDDWRDIDWSIVETDEVLPDEWDIE